jgi:uncharacterized protein
MSPPPNVDAKQSDAALLHRFRSTLGEHVLVVPHSRIFDVVGEVEAEADWVAAVAGTIADEEPLNSVPEPAPQSISLNVSSSCNLTCGYCYAARGGFGGKQATAMDWSVAQGAIDRLVAGADPNFPITIGFLGGEPFVNRRLIHRAVDYAVGVARARALDIRFSVTTNATLLKAEDLDLFRAHPFAVTVSLDGQPSDHDENRRRRTGGSGSWSDAIEKISPLLERPGGAKIAARATVTRAKTDLAGWVETLSLAGFPEVGVAPLRVAPGGAGALTEADWPEYLAGLIAAARVELLRFRSGMPIRLTNLAIALKQLHRGAASPYPCGAGGGYFSVSAKGRWYACHRAIGESAFELGDNDGLDAERRRSFLLKGHVHAQTECASCWARYLCSGGCHQEAAARTAASCDFVRGWLSFCLEAYCNLGVSAKVETQRSGLLPR